MNNSIKLEIPLEAETLITTATMLTGLAASLKGESITAPVKLETETIEHIGGADDEKKQPANSAPPAPANGVTSVDLDSSGLPWDGRIHSAGKTKLVKDQTWKKKRGLDPALVLQVETELRQAMAAPAAPVTTPPAETTAAEAFAEPETAIPPLADTQVPPASITPAPATTIPPAATTEPLTFPIIMAKVTNAMSLGTLTQEMITATVIKLGIASITLLSARPDLIDAVNAELFPNG